MLRKILGTGAIVDTETQSFNAIILRTRIIILNNTQILNLRATPVELIAAPGIGKFLHLERIIIFFDWVADYTEDGDDDMVVRFGNASGPIASSSLSAPGFIDQGADAIVEGSGGTNDILLKTTTENKSLVLGKISGAGEFGGGNAGNIFRTHVMYNILNTGF